jgi:hypothetical protein
MIARTLQKRAAIQQEITASLSRLEQTPQAKPRSRRLELTVRKSACQVFSRLGADLLFVPSYDHQVYIAASVLLSAGNRSIQQGEVNSSAKFPSRCFEFRNNPGSLLDSALSVQGTGESRCLPKIQRAAQIGHRLPALREFYIPKNAVHLSGAGVFSGDWHPSTSGWMVHRFAGKA